MIASEWIYKVSAVSVIPPQRNSSNEKIDWLKQDKKPDNSFDALLSKECSKYSVTM